MRIFASSLLLVSVLAFFIPIEAFAAEDPRVIELRQQIEALERQASQYKSNIADERSKADSLRKEISLLSTQIQSIENQLALTGKKIERTTFEIRGVEGTIGEKETSISRKKESIGRLVFALDQHDQENMLELLIKSSSMSDFLRQEQYAESVAGELLNVIEELKHEKAVLEGSRQELKVKEKELEQLSAEQLNTKLSLGSAKSGKNTLLTRTKGQEAEYQKMLKEIEKRQAEFFADLIELEQKVIAGGFYNVRVQAQSVPPKGTKIFQPPYPKGEYVITQGFGMTSYARRGAYGGKPHSGVDLVAGHGTPVRSIGDGVIIASGLKNPGWGNWIAVKHPNDLVSVYGHLSSVVGFGQGAAVQAGTVVGFEGSTGNSTGSHLHLSLYKEFFTYTNESNGMLYFNYLQGTINALDYM
ncbi:MAG: peptidoglycan DD-metalloendopeptidase family protein [Patescibacteria group bacterium]